MCSPAHATETHRLTEPEPPEPELWNPDWPAAGPVGRALAQPFVGVILLYRVTLSPFVGRQCRFEPTCSLYGLGAYRVYGPIRGTRLTLRRVLRCRPRGGQGYDPVPIRRDG